MTHYKSLFPKSILFILILLCHTDVLHAQGLDLMSNFADTVIHSTFTTAAASGTHTESYLSPTQMHVFAAEQSLLNGISPSTPSFATKFDVSYGFTRMNSKLGNEGLANTSVVTPEFVLQNVYGFALDVTASYQNDSTKDNTPSHGTADTYGFTMQAGQNIFKIWNPTHFPNDSLTVGLLLGASRDHSGKTTPKDHVGTTADSIKLSPNLTYAHVLTGHFSLSALSSYSLAWKDTMNQNPPDYNTDAGVFSLGSRLDYKQSSSLTLSVGASWNRNLNQTVATGTIPYYGDWAQFSCAAQYDFPIGKLAGNIKVSYTYVAFRPDYDAHSITVQAAVQF